MAMKGVETLLNIVAHKKPRRAFSVRGEKKTIVGLEQEFVLTPSTGPRAEQIQVEYTGVNQRLLKSGRSLHFISVRAAAEKYQLAARTIQQLCREGKLISKRQGESENSPWLVADESVRAYYEAQRA